MRILSTKGNSEIGSLIFILLAWWGYSHFFGGKSLDEQIKDERSLTNRQIIHLQEKVYELENRVRFLETNAN